MWQSYHAKPALKKNRVLLAYTVAIIADAIQLPFCFFAFTGFMLPISEAIVTMVDIAAMIAISLLIGFDWILLPSFLVEAVIGLDAIPTWTLAVAYLTRKSKNAVACVKPEPPVIDVEAVRISSEPRQVTERRTQQQATRS